MPSANCIAMSLHPTEGSQEPDERTFEQHRVAAPMTPRPVVRSRHARGYGADPPAGRYLECCKRTGDARVASPGRHDTVLISASCRWSKGVSGGCQQGSACARSASVATAFWSPALTAHLGTPRLACAPSTTL